MWSKTEDNIFSGIFTIIFGIIICYAGFVLNDIYLVVMCIVIAIVLIILCWGCIIIKYG